MKKEMIKTCPNCGNKFTPNRSNQKYCDAECKIQANNEVIMQHYHENKAEHEIMRRINLQLKNNYLVLQRYTGKSMRLPDLEKEGFNHQILTSFSSPSKDAENMVFLCYDIPYYFLSETDLFISNPIKLNL